MALEGHRTLLCAGVVDWMVLVACFRDIQYVASLEKGRLFRLTPKLASPFLARMLLKSGAGSRVACFRDHTKYGDYLQSRHTSDTKDIYKVDIETFTPRST